MTGTIMYCPLVQQRRFASVCRLCEPIGVPMQDVQDATTNARLESSILVVLGEPEGDIRAVLGPHPREALTVWGLFSLMGEAWRGVERSIAGLMEYEFFRKRVIGVAEFGPRMEGLVQ